MTEVSTARFSASAYSLGRAPTVPPNARAAARIAAIAESATPKVDAKAKARQAEGRPVISYAAGEPDFPTPANIVEAASRAVLDPKNYKYTPAAGLPELREAIAAKTAKGATFIT